MIPFLADDWPLWINLLVFAAAAGVVWFGGTRISAYADALADKTGIGRAFLGALLLGGVTSLPEGATTITATAIGNVPLAVNNLFGGVAMQVAVIAAADVLFRPALSSQTRDSSTAMQAALLVLTLMLGAAGIVMGDTLVFGVGVWTTAILMTTIAAFYLIHRDGLRKSEKESSSPSRSQDRDRQRDGRELPLGALILRMTAAAVAILTGGIVLAQTGDILAEQTGLGSSFVGAVLIAIATSLPEVSTTFGAVRIGAFTMAFSNIFGANLLDMSILFLADAVYVGQPILGLVDRFAVMAALLATTLTAIYLIGILWNARRNRRIGLDSLLVLAVYAGGLVLLYTIR